jgi:hypothetical protein
VSAERAEEYQRTAARLHTLALAAVLPEVRAELLWLAQSYQRLASMPATTCIVEGHRSLEVSVTSDLGRKHPDPAGLERPPYSKA